jgi:CPA1 family monovalent cation:H+ antiporter
MYFISSGAVEVNAVSHKVRLGRGDFFGEMALLSGQPRQADVFTLSYCQ